MFDRGVVHDHVENNLYASLVDFGNQLQYIVHAAVFGSDVGVVRNIVTEIRLRGGEEWRDPNGFEAQPLDVIQLLEDAWQISNPISIAVIKGTRVDLVNACLVIPRESCHPVTCRFL